MAEMMRCDAPHVNEMEFRMLRAHERLSPLSLRRTIELGLGRHERLRGAFGLANRKEGAALEAVEQPFRGEEAEGASVTSDDAGGAIMNFDDIGIGHACSFAADCDAPV